jgi:pimeloyl-ACP methyl ester carboxylesterase
MLGDAISQEVRRDGHYFLYRPANVEPQTPRIVFLHGFGGNFHYYTWMMKQAFPGAVVIAPSYGIAWSREARTYLDEVLANAEQRLGVPIRRPWLVALSAGGPAGFEFYNATPDRFRGLICLASCPHPDQVATLKPGLNVLMINGVRDDRFPIDVVRKTIAPLHLQAIELEDADHFFLLTDREHTIRLMKNFLDR